MMRCRYLLFVFVVLMAFFLDGGQKSHAQSSAPPSYVQTFYVRAPGAQYGTGDGSDWANAFTDLPENLVRGAKYYLASGVYSAGATIPPTNIFGDPYHVFEDDEQGDLYIGVFKATADDHGTDIGWQEAFGQGAAQLGQLRFITGYYEVDGQAGAGTQGHGFRLYMGACADNQKAVYFPWNSTSTHIELRHLDMGLCGEQGTSLAHEAIYSHTSFYREFPLSYITISDCYIHDTNKNFISMIEWSDVVVENNYFARTGEQDDSHAIGSLMPINVTIRNNVFEDVRSSYINLNGDATNVQIYSNVFKRTPEWGELSTHGYDRDVYAIVDNWDTVTNMFFYNNTIYNVRGYAAGIRFTGSLQNVQIYNNLWANNRVNQIDLAGISGQEHDYNAFHENWNKAGDHRIDDDEISEPHKQLIEDPPFIAPENDDFRLAFATNPGLTLPAPFDLDFDSVPRGGDGVWDRGAFEFFPALILSGIPANQAIDLNWRVNITLPVTTTWHIEYFITPTEVMTATDPSSATRTYALAGLTNGEWYTVNLEAMVGASVYLSATVRVMPTDIFVYLPMITNQD